MPNAKVLLFARLSELAGTRETAVELGEGITVSDAYTMLAARFPALAPLRNRVMFAVNSEYVEPTHPLSEGDELALIPPVSGGARAL